MNNTVEKVKVNTPKEIIERKEKAEKAMKDRMENIINAALTVINDEIWKEFDIENKTKELFIKVGSSVFSEWDGGERNNPIGEKEYKYTSTEVMNRVKEGGWSIDSNDVENGTLKLALTPIIM